MHGNPELVSKFLVVCVHLCPHPPLFFLPFPPCFLFLAASSLNHRHFIRVSIHHFFLLVPQQDLFCVSALSLWASQQGNQLLIYKAHSCTPETKAHKNLSSMKAIFLESNFNLYPFWLLRGKKTTHGSTSFSGIPFPQVPPKQKAKYIGWRLTEKSLGY